MWIDRLTSSRTTQALELAAQFAEQRQHVLAENLANIDTPDHATRRLDPETFQKSLQTALDQAQAGGANANTLELRGNAQFQTTQDGRVRVEPAIEPAENVLFHDGTNARIEKTIADTNANALSYEMTMNFLRSRFDTLLRAIRGRSS